MTQRTGPRRAVAPIVNAVVQPVTKRLARIEGLLLEMRNEQDVKLKRLDKIQKRLDDLAETVIANRGHIDRLSKLVRSFARTSEAVKTPA
jgi:hypothetical protein